MSIKLEVGKRYVRRDGDVTGPLVDNSVGHLYTFKDPTTYQTYTSKGRYDIQNIHGADLVAEYVEPTSIPEPTPKQQDTLPAEPVPGKWYKTRGGCRAFYVGKTTSKYVYEVVYGMSEGLKNYSCPFTFGTGTYVSDLDIISEWKESITLPPVEIKRWYVVQSTDHPTLTTIKRGDVLFVADTKEKAEAYISGDKDCEIVEVVGILPTKEITK